MYLRSLCLLCSFLILFSCKNSTEKEPDPSLNSVNDSIVNSPSKSENSSDNSTITSIENIQAEYSQLQQMLKEKLLDSSGFSYKCYDEKSGNVVFYSDKNGLRIIKQSYNEYSHFSTERNYYLKNDSLFFIFVKDVSWSFSGTKNDKPQTKDQVTERRFYLIDGKPVSCLKKEYSILSDSDKNPDPSQIPSEKDNCNMLNELQKTFEILLPHQNTTGEIDCLEE